MSDDSGIGQYPPIPRGPKHSGRQLLKFPVVLGLYTVPAIVNYTGWPIPFIPRSVGELVCLVVPAVWFCVGVVLESETFLPKTLEADRLRAVVSFPQSGRWEPEINPVAFGIERDSVPDVDEDRLRLEYESLISEAQYRDALLIRTTYFSLGAVGLFAGLVSTASSTSEETAIAMVASLVMLAFAIAANSYKDSRDALWDRIGRLENNVEAFRGMLTTFNSVRAMDRRLLNTVSLSSYTVGFTVLMTVLSYGCYCWLVVVAN